MANVTVTIGNRATITKTLPGEFFGTQIQRTGAYDVDSPNWFEMVRNLRPETLRINDNNFGAPVPPSGGGDLPALAGTGQTPNEMFTLFDRLWQQPANMRTSCFMCGIETRNQASGVPYTTNTGSGDPESGPNPPTTGPGGTGSDGRMRQWMDWIKQRHGLQALGYVEPANEPALMYTGHSGNPWYSSSTLSAAAAQWWINNQRYYFEAAKLVDTLDQVMVGGPAYAAGQSPYMNQWMRDHIQGYSGWKHGAFGPGTPGNIPNMDVLTLHAYGHNWLVGNGLVEDAIIGSGGAIPKFQKLANSYFYPSWDGVTSDSGGPPNPSRKSGLMGMYKRQRELLDQCTGGSLIPIFSSEFVGNLGSGYPGLTERWTGAWHDSAYGMVSVMCAGDFHATNNPHGSGVIGYIRQGPNRTWRFSTANGVVVQGDRLIYTLGSLDGGTTTARAGNWSFHGSAGYWVQRRICSRYIRDFKRQIPVTVAGNVNTPTWDESGTNWDNNAVSAIQVVAARLNSDLVGADPFATDPNGSNSDKDAVWIMNVDCLNSHTVTVTGFSAAGKIAQVYLPTNVADVSVAKTNVDLTRRTFDASGGSFTFTIGPHEAHLFEIPRSAGTTPTPTLPKAHTLIDPFDGTNDSVPDQSRWWSEGATIQSNRLRLMNDRSAGMTYAYAISQQQFDLTASYMHMRVINADSGELAFGAAVNDDNRVTMWLWNGFLRSEIRVNGVATAGPQVAWNATTMAWWRITEASGTVRLQYAASVDGPWTDLHTTPTTTINFTTVNARITAGSSTVDTGITEIEDYNNFPRVGVDLVGRADTRFSAHGALTVTGTTFQGIPVWVTVSQPIVTPRGEYRELLPDGSYGSQLRWDKASGTFKYA